MGLRSSKRLASVFAVGAAPDLASKNAPGLPSQVTLAAKIQNDAFFLRLTTTASNAAASAVTAAPDSSALAAAQATTWPRCLCPRQQQSCGCRRGRD